MPRARAFRLRVRAAQPTASVDDLAPGLRPHARAEADSAELLGRVALANLHGETLGAEPGNGPLSPGSVKLGRTMWRMVVGQCPRCSTPYTAAAVTAYGVLRPRRAHKGGPYVLYACESCGRQIRLVPHGHGRYAPPGEPPPPPVPEDARRPPWVHHEAPPREAPRETVDPPPASTPDEAPPVGIGAAVLRAYETLGLEPGATRVQIAQSVSGALEDLPSGQGCPDGRGHPGAGQRQVPGASRGVRVSDFVAHGNTAGIRPIDRILRS